MIAELVENHRQRRRGTDIFIDDEDPQLCRRERKSRSYGVSRFLGLYGAAQADWHPESFEGTPSRHGQGMVLQAASYGSRDPTAEPCFRPYAGTHPGRGLIAQKRHLRLCDIAPSASPSRYTRIRYARPGG